MLDFIGNGKIDRNGNGHFYKGNYTDADIDLSVVQNKLKVWNNSAKMAQYITDNGINDYYLYFSANYPKVIMLYYK